MRKLFIKHYFQGAAAVLLGLMLVVLLILSIPSPLPHHQIYGVTFSQSHADGIGLDWQEVYDAILEDLKVRHLRLSAYWETIEPIEGEFDFSVLDYQMDKAAEHNAEVILGVGRKLPRWPECHIPGWAEDLSEDQQQEKAMRMIEVVVLRYKDHPALKMWQMKNEPFLAFGICPPKDKEFLERQENLIRSLDDAHPILVTDSGELSSWLPASRFGDVFGTTLYRTVFSKRTERLFHYDYIFPAAVYRIRSRYINALRGKEVIISELQGEPWGEMPWTEASKEERIASFSPERFLDIKRFASRTQLSKAYWWGVEYWYWEKELHDDDRYWEFARTLFKNKE